MPSPYRLGFRHRPECSVRRRHRYHRSLLPLETEWPLSSLPEPAAPNLAVWRVELGRPIAAPWIFGSREVLSMIIT